jgi:hypothetical protein
MKTIQPRVTRRAAQAVQGRLPGRRPSIADGLDETGALLQAAATSPPPSPSYGGQANLEGIGTLDGASLVRTVRRRP